MSFASLGAHHRAGVTPAGGSGSMIASRRMDVTRGVALGVTVRQPSLDQSRRTPAGGACARRDVASSREMSAAAASKRRVDRQSDMGDSLMSRGSAGGAGGSPVEL